MENQTDMERLLVYTFIAWQISITVLLGTIVYQLNQRPGLKDSEMAELIKMYCKMPN